MRTSTVIKNIEANKELSKAIKSNNYASIESFIYDAKTYVKAIKENRMICRIGSVSKTGMSRTLKFNSCERNKYNKSFYHRQYIMFFELLGYKVDDKGFTRIHGCGMDMIFHTNYTIIHKLGRLGILTKEEVEILAQRTPTVL